MPLTNQQRAVDCSNWNGPIPRATFEAMRAEGVRTVICGTDGNPPLFPAQAVAARLAGLEVEAYVYLYFGSGGTAYDVVERTNRKLDMVDMDGHVKRVWLDCEDTTSGLGPSELVALIAGARDAVQARGYVCGIYTGAWWWVPYTGDSKGFWDLPLWAAQYDDVADVDAVTPFGGWQQAFRKQYTDKGTAGGITPLDLDVERVLEAAPVPEAPQPLDDFQRGRLEMYLGIKKLIDELPGPWGIPV